MWFFRSPFIVFGEDALSHLEQVTGRRAFIVTDAVMEKLGYVQKVQDRLAIAGIRSAYFAEVEPEPNLKTVRACARAISDFEPDWVVGLGGGSSLDAAKAAWFIYERPEIELESVNVIEQYGLRAKARLMTIPTTAGSGSEVSHAALITDTDARRKLELASWEFVADLTIVDPMFSAHMPRQLTADTGIDVLTHAVEVYNNAWSNDFTDGLCLQAVWMVFRYLLRATIIGEADAEARTKMANAATIAGLAVGNTNISLAHAMSHSVGGIFPIPHGRIAGLILPYTVEYTANGGLGRYLDLTNLLGLTAVDEAQAGVQFAGAIRDLLQQIGQPVSLKDAGISQPEFEAELEALCDRAEIDLGMVMARRYPGREDLKRLFEYAFDGRAVDF